MMMSTMSQEKLLPTLAADFAKPNPIRTMSLKNNVPFAAGGETQRHGFSPYADNGGYVLSS